MSAGVRGGWPTLAIMVGASVWGMVWYPLRMLAALGVTGTAASAATSAAGCLLVLVLRRRAIATVRWHRVLPMLGLAAGVTNLGFVWGAIHGEVMRVLLLFYLTPAWTALFAHFILNERLTRSGGALAALSLMGAVLMLWSPAPGVPLPGNAAEWAGLAGGMGFAMSNVLVVKTSRVLPQMKAEMRTAVIFGGAALFGAFASCFEPMAAAPAGEHLAAAVLLVLALGFVLASNNMLVQYGLARVPANRASIIMLFEIVVTALTSWLFAGEVPGPREWAGGGCIVLASLLSGWVHRRQAARARRGGGPTQDDAADACGRGLACTDAGGRGEGGPAREGVAGSQRRSGPGGERADDRDHGRNDDAPEDRDDRGIGRDTPPGRSAGRDSDDPAVGNDGAGHGERRDCAAGASRPPRGARDGARAMV